MKKYTTIITAVIIVGLLIGSNYLAKKEDTNKEATLVTPIVGLEKVGAGAVLLDVRTPSEYAEGHVESAINLDWEDSTIFTTKVSELSKDATYVLYCRSGNRSSQAASYMKNQGFKNVFSVEGGILSGKLPLTKEAVPAGSKSQEIKVILDKALIDEYKAKATYEKVLEKYPGARPFSNIINAEQKHIDSLLSLYAKYQLKAPSYQNDLPAYTGTISEACKTGVQAEILNAKLYTEELIPATSGYTDVANVFSSLSAASQNNHLPAFQKCS